MAKNGPVDCHEREEYERKKDRMENKRRINIQTTQMTKQKRSKRIIRGRRKLQERRRGEERTGERGEAREGPERYIMYAYICSRLFSDIGFDKTAGSYIPQNYSTLVFNHHCKNITVLIISTPYLRTFHNIIFQRKFYISSFKNKLAISTLFHVFPIPLLLPVIILPY